MRPETKARYPLNWRRISSWTIRARGNKCESCGVRNGERGKVLTVHHIDYDPSNNALGNLAVLCTGCHLRRQAQDLSDTTRYGKAEILVRLGQLELPGFELPRAKNWRQALKDRAGGGRCKSVPRAPPDSGRE